MGKTLVIVESPSKAKTIEKFLGKNKYVVLASLGHVRDLPKSQFGIDVENDFEVKYITIRGKGDKIKAALLAYAAMVERCETKQNELNDKIEDIKRRGDYGSCGSCRYEDCGCTWSNGCYTLPAEIEIPIKTINYILKGSTDERKG